jgi:hypothetical protein
MDTDQEDEVDVLARAVSSMSEELASKTLECERYRRALAAIAEQDYRGPEPMSRNVARKALNP